MASVDDFQAAKEQSRNPAGEVVYMISHGPAEAGDKERELANLMRESVAAATVSCKRVIVVPVVVVSRSGVSGRIERDLAGLDYTSTHKGIAESPLFSLWVQETLASALP